MVRTSMLKTGWVSEFSSTEHWWGALIEERSSHLYTQFLQLQKESLKKSQACTGFEPLTSVIPVQGSTNEANKPTGSRSLNWFVINPWKDDDEVLKIWKSYIHNFNDSERKQQRWRRQRERQKSKRFIKQIIASGRRRFMLKGRH